jgi:transcriptional regulator with XRE-family HTH domain
MKNNYNRIKIVLVEQNKTSLWLSEQIKKDKSTISRWCTNDMQPSIETLFVIAEILNVSVRELLSEKIQ